MTSKLFDAISEVRLNPGAIQRKVLESLESSMNGELEIPDPTNPFVFLLEASAVTAAAAMSQDEALTRKQYPSVATNQEDIYLHMSDVDYVGRFSTPSRATFTLLLGRDELYNKAIPTGQNNVSKIIIPKNTVFSAAGYQFSMQYPIEIRVMGHGGLQIVYDVEETSPLYTLDSNIVDWDLVTFNDIDFIHLEIPTHQFVISSSLSPINAGTPFKKIIPFSDNYYYCRIYMSESDGSWTEIKTTHTGQVFDPMDPTAVLQVNDTTLTVSIPEVYYSAANLTRELRVDIYTTKGPLELLLDNYDISKFSAEWIDLGGDAETSKYISPLFDYKTISAFCNKRVTGGSLGLTFAELRERVINGAAGTGDLPITDVQLYETMSDLGYNLVKRIDNITRRIYMASKELPKPSDGSVSAGIGATMGMVEVNLNDLVELSTVSDNGKRITIKPDTLYEFIDGITTIVSDSRKAELINTPVESLASAVNESSFVYSPFHYVLDSNDNVFYNRGYYLERPEVESKQFVAENGSAVVEVSVGGHYLERTENGYKLTLQVRSGQSFKDLDIDRVTVQLSYVPELEVDRAYINGELTGYIDDEPVYEFELNTDWDLDGDDNIILNTFKMYDENTVRKTATKLLTDFDIFFSVQEHFPEGAERSDIDLELGHFMLPSNPLGVVHERISIRLGYALNEMWTNARAVAGSEEYMTHTTDVPAVYKQNVYKYGADGLIEMEIVGDNLVATKLFDEGDPILDENGEATFEYVKGDLMRDVDGMPILKHGRGMKYQIDLMFLDGIYRFATGSQAVAYRDEVPSIIVDWLKDDIAEISKQLLEQTKLYFRPKTTYGNIGVVVGEGKQITIPSEQSFSVDFYMGQVAWRNTDLRASLTDTAVAVIAEVLNKATATIDDMIATLKTRVGEDVISIDITGLGGAEKLNAVTVIDDSTRCSIKKVITVLANETTIVEDDVKVNFILHQS